MKFKIMADSSCDLSEELRTRMDISIIPFKIDIDEEQFIDDLDLDVSLMVESMNRSLNPIRTSCPAPGDFLDEFNANDNIFVITISNKLSGTYNSAVLARDMVLEKAPDKFIHIFNSKSASIGESLIALKIEEAINLDLSREDIIKYVDNYIEGMDTYFILESLDNLIKNGRISKTKGLIANVLNIKPIMGSDKDGNIQLVENVRGNKRAFKRLAEIVGENREDIENTVIGIAHVQNRERAESLKEEIETHYKFKDILIVEARGLSSGYAADSGIVLAL